MERMEQMEQRVDDDDWSDADLLRDADGDDDYEIDAYHNQ